MGKKGIDWGYEFFDMMQAVPAWMHLNLQSTFLSGENPFFVLAGLGSEELVEVALAA